MAIVGLGTDIVEVSRIADILERTGERLPQRILTTHEWVTYQNHGQKMRYLAKRFAVKEAAAKALGTGIRDGLAFNQFEVVNDALGKPQLRLSGRAAQLAEQMGIDAIHVSISDEHRYACATVIMESTT